MWLQEKEFSIKLGGNFFVNVPTLVAFEGESLFAVRRQDDGYLGIDFEVYSETGEKIASVKKNNIHLGNKDAYALDGDADSMRLVSKSSDQNLVEIKKRLAAAPVELDVSVQTYLPDGRLMDLSPDSSNLGGIPYAALLGAAHGAGTPHGSQC